VVNSCYVVPHEGGRERLQAARATTEYYGRPVFSNLAMVRPAGEWWYARAIIFFKAYEKISEWNELRMQWVRGEKVHDLVLLRWYKITGWTDAVKCDILEWDSVAGKAWILVEDISLIQSVEMVLPKTTQTQGKELWYRNRYFR
jgi:hypothetical protein